MKVYKGRQKLSLEQAAGYYSFAYKIGVEHGERTERQRLIDLLEEYEVSKHWMTASTLQAISKFRRQIVEQMEGKK